jgi:hypothetical protein
MPPPPAPLTVPALAAATPARDHPHRPGLSRRGDHPPGVKWLRRSIRRGAHSGSRVRPLHAASTDHYGQPVYISGHMTVIQVCLLAHGVRRWRSGIRAPPVTPDPRCSTLSRCDQGDRDRAAKPGDGIGIGHRVGGFVGQVGVFIDEDDQRGQVRGYRPGAFACCREQCRALRAPRPRPAEARRLTREWWRAGQCMTPTGLVPCPLQVDGKAVVLPS